MTHLPVASGRLSIESANGVVAAQRAHELEEKYNELSSSRLQTILQNSKLSFSFMDLAENHTCTMIFYLHAAMLVV